MGRHHDRVERQERAAGRRLLLEHVERRAGDDAVAERIDQIVQIHDRAAADVDEAGRALHLRELRGAEEFFRARRVRGGDDDEVALPQQVIQPVRAPQRHADRRLLRDRVHGEDAHAEGETAACRLAADAAQTDHAQRAVGQGNGRAVGGMDFARPAVAR